MGRVYCDLDCTRYHTPGHPETPDRVASPARRLSAAGHRLQAPERPATAADVGTVHAPGHFAAVRDGDYCDPDTPHYDGIEAFALKSLACALSAAECARSGEPAFSLMRPPGHHAGHRRIAGFCYFNNIAISVAKALADDPAARVGILDIDAHHGDGTQELMLGRDRALYISLHRFPFYPGTGERSEQNCVNFPLRAGAGESAYLEAFERGLLVLEDFRPSLVAVSAGFDGYKSDPLAQLGLERATYRKIGALIARLRTPRFALLEGGYAGDLAILVENFLEGFF